MILHPSGGSLDVIIKTRKPIAFAHGLAIFCLPFVVFGFFGLTKKLSDKSGISVLAFITIGIGVIAAMFAAIFNGLALPHFLSLYENNLNDSISHLRPITKFSFAVNRALDYIFISSFCLAVFLYSILIVTSRRLPVWIGYLGISLILFALFGLLLGFEFIGLFGFRIFTFALAGWILLTSFYLFSRHASAK